MARTTTIKRPSDLHTHIREGELLPQIAKVTAKNFAYIEVMPNTTKPILTGPEAIAYRDLAEQHTGSTRVIPSIKITPDTTEAIIWEAVSLGVKAGKLYFGITTNEAEGAKTIDPYLPALRVMEKYGMMLLIHGEMAYNKDGSKIINLRREEAFVPTAKRIVNEFTELKVVFEHITTKEMVDFVHESYKNGNDRIAATITVQHLRTDIDAVLGYVDPTTGGEGINPHNYCKPVLKYPEDREALLWAATSGLGCFFFGSDSAPHLTENKECCCGKPGVFSALTRIETLAEIFDAADKMNMLEGFISIFGPEFYGLLQTNETITLINEPWEIPAEFAGITNYRKGETVSWRIVEE